eukprot:CAMPEP_0170538174 /NCGR_PEP_ID=MMETSP0209-20121228/103157_1 /TAXON_ID=665100 ORGANISM="Litonotus pictus, Strain P1" /NCGR_SAMPLE_ID=MMETSP0209 /ASSEMBLY_ACC=CAM_ASM_000301 /LENGTH=1050 /DNA_ID=CAMNT_0010839821 /DNA_START=1433 /DNA_END=4582 /DNA_ORIENTATION=+
MQNQNYLFVDLDKRKLERYVSNEIRKEKEKEGYKSDIGEINDEKLFEDFNFILDEFMDIITSPNSNTKSQKVNNYKESIIFKALNNLYTTLSTCYEENKGVLNSYMKNIQGLAYNTGTNRKEEEKVAKESKKGEKKESGGSHSFQQNLNKLSVDLTNKRHPLNYSSYHYYFEGSDPKISTLNKRIQEEFYGFVLSVLSVIYNQFVLVIKADEGLLGSIGLKEQELHERELTKYHSLKAKKAEDQASFTSIKRKKLLIEKLSSIENNSLSESSNQRFWSEFYKLKKDFRFCYKMEIEQSNNVQPFFAYMCGDRLPDLEFLEISFKIFEEFLSVKKHKVNNGKDHSINFFEIIDKIRNPTLGKIKEVKFDLLNTVKRNFIFEELVINKQELIENEMNKNNHSLKNKDLIAIEEKSKDKELISKTVRERIFGKENPQKMLSFKYSKIAKDHISKISEAEESIEIVTRKNSQDSMSKEKEIGRNEVLFNRESKEQHVFEETYQNISHKFGDINMKKMNPKSYEVKRNSICNKLSNTLDTNEEYFNSGESKEIENVAKTHQETSLSILKGGESHNQSPELYYHHKSCISLNLLNGSNIEHDSLKLRKSHLFFNYNKSSKRNSEKYSFYQRNIQSPFSPMKKMFTDSNMNILTNPVISPNESLLNLICLEKKKEGRSSVNSIRSDKVFTLIDNNNNSILDFKHIRKEEKADLNGRVLLQYRNYLEKNLTYQRLREEYIMKNLAKVTKIHSEEITDIMTKVFNTKGYMNVDSLIKSVYFSCFILTRHTNRCFYDEIYDLCKILDQIDEENNMHFLRKYIITIMVYYNRNYIDSEGEGSKKIEEEIVNLNSGTTGEVKSTKESYSGRISSLTNYKAMKNVNNFMQKIINSIIQKEITPNDLMLFILNDIKPFEISSFSSLSESGEPSTNSNSKGNSENPSSGRKVKKYSYPELLKNSCKCGIKTLKEIHALYDVRHEEKYFFKCLKCKKVNNETPIGLILNLDSKKHYAELCSPLKLFNMSESLISRFFAKLRLNMEFDTLFMTDLVEVLVNLLVYIK